VKEQKLQPGKAAKADPRGPNKAEPVKRKPFPTQKNKREKKQS
jgi:hypothetical protein